MIVSINQPAYLPWDGYYDRIRQSDLHIVLDHVQLEKGSFTNRTRIREKSPRGWQWLTVPVEKGKPINETRISDDHWLRKHGAALEQTYGANSLWFDLYGIGDYETLWEACYASTDLLFGRLGIVGKPIVRSPYLNVPGTKSELILNLCREVQADIYLSGPQGRNYLDTAAFQRANIEIRYHHYEPASDPPLSAVDSLFPMNSHSSSSDI